MKILYFIESLRSGGKERRLVELINKIVQNPENECYLVLLQNDYHFRKDLNKKIRLITITKGKRKNPFIFFHFFRYCLKISPDIIHVWGNMPAFYALPSSIILHIPFVNSQITSTEFLKPQLSFYYLSHKINFALSKYVTANSKAGLNTNNLIGKKYSVIYNGVSLERFEIKDKLDEINNSSLKNTIKIVMVGSFTKFKNYDIFLDLAKYYQRKRNDITFIAVGDGENLEKIKDRIVLENVKNVILTGAVSNVEEIVFACDIGVLFSPFGEGFSNAILEYMALSKPVIASNKGGNSELIDHNVTGFMVEEDCVDDVTFYLDKLFSDNELRKTMSEKGREKIEKYFTVEKMVENFNALYKKTLK